MSLVALANHLAEKGRGDDKMLVHMTPGEVQGLQALALAHGGSLTVNPETGLVEAGFLKKLLPAIAGFALNFIAPGVGTAIGGMLGLGGAAGTAIAVGGLTGLATGSLRQGIMAGLGAYGGASLAGGLMSASGAEGVAGAMGVPGAATGTGSQAAMLAEQTAGFGSEGLQRLAESAAKAKGATPSLVPSFMAGVKGLGTEAGRSAFMQGVGGTSGLMRAGTAAMLGADAFVPTATPMPSGGGFQYPPRIRPMSWNQYTGELEQLPMFSAINKAGTTPASAPAPAQEQQPPGMNSGGIVALANGGTPDPTQMGNPNATQIAAQQKIVNDPQAAAFNEVQAGMLKGLSYQQIADAANAKFGKSFNAQNVQDFIAANPTVRPLSGIYASDPTQRATPTAEQLAAQKTILPDPQSAALGLVRSGVATGLTDQQIADLANQTYGKSFSAQNVADFMRANNINRPAPVTAVSPTFTDTDTDTTVTPAPLPGLPDFAPTTPTLIPATQFTPQTMEEVRTKYEQGGGATRMPTITDILPTDRTYTQNQAFALLDGYLKANPNAQYSEVSAFARSKGIPEMQARAAYNEFRFSGMTGGSKSAYDYLMGRGAYPVNQVLPGNAPLMRPYLEASGIASAPGFFGRKSIPTTPTSQTAQSAGTGSTTTSGVTGGGTSTTGGNTSAAFMGTTGGAKAAVTGDNRTYADQATIKGGVVVGNNVVDPISGRVIGTITANVDDGTGGIVVGSVIVDPISGRIIGQAEDAGFISRLVDKKVGEQLAPITDAKVIPVSDRAVEVSEYDPFAFDYDVGSGELYNDEELALMAGMRKGGLADVVAAAAARGGNVRQYNLGSYSDGGRLLRGPGDGVSDSIPAVIGNKQPARLADGEFVIPARIVSELGNGSTEAGARKLYAMMDRVQRARAKTTGKGRVAKNTRADKHLPA